MRYRVLMASVAIMSFGQGAVAAELGAPSEPLFVEIHGFVSQGFIWTTDNNYLADSEKGSFEFTEAGVNFTKPVTDDLRVGVQIFARKLGPTGTYNAKLDWFYLDYRWKDWLGIRAGRVKIPFGLYNDTSDIDSARVPVLLPQSIYPTLDRDFLLAQSGAEVYGHAGLASAGALDYRLYGGTIFVELPNQTGNPVQLQKISTPYVVGGRVLWETPLDGMRTGASLQDLRLDAKILLPGVPAPVTVEVPALLAVGSLEYANHGLLFAAEYSRWFTSTKSDNPAAYPSSPQVVSERAYAMAAYRVNRWLEPGAYYSVLYVDVDKRHGREAVQNDLASTLRFDINANWLVKLEGHYMQGTAALSADQNDGLPISALRRDWGLFLVKTTANF